VLPGPDPRFRVSPALASRLLLMADELPLHTAARKGDMAALEVLLGMADVAERLGSRDSHNRTPLHLACYENHGAVVTKLIEAGASPNATAKMGFSALHFAAQANALDALQELLSKGANPNVWEGRKKSTPLHIAAAKGYAEAVSLLLKHGANPISKTKKSETAFDLGRKHASVNAVIEAHVAAAAATSAVAATAPAADAAAGEVSSTDGGHDNGGACATSKSQPSEAAAPDVRAAVAQESTPSTGLGSTRPREEEEAGVVEEGASGLGHEGGGKVADDEDTRPKKRAKKRKKAKIGGMDHLLDDSAF